MTIRRIVAMSALTAVIGSVSAARADVTKAQCIDANTSAQALRREGKLSEARAALAVCSDPQCPSLVRDDCTRQLDALEQAQPTILFDVTGPSGADLAEVRVGVDGRPFVEKLDGAPLRVDPGQHEFTFEASGMLPVTRALVIKESDKGRRERVTMAPQEPQRKDPETRERPATSGGTRNLSYVLGGVGAAALVTGSLFGVLASSKWSAAKSECSGPDSCPSYGQAVSDHGATVTDATLSTIGFLAGGALLAAGAVLYFTGQPTSPAIAPALSPSSATLTLTGRFQ
jgi:hypothetical protein